MWFNGLGISTANSKQQAYQIRKSLIQFRNSWEQEALTGFKMWNPSWITLGLNSCMRSLQQDVRSFCREMSKLFQEADETRTNVGQNQFQLSFGFIGAKTERYRGISNRYHGSRKYLFRLRCHWTEHPFRSAVFFGHFFPRRPPVYAAHAMHNASYLYSQRLTSPNSLHVSYIAYATPYCLSAVRLRVRVKKDREKDVNRRWWAVVSSGPSFGNMMHRVCLRLGRIRINESKR